MTRNHRFPELKGLLLLAALVVPGTLAPRGAPAQEAAADTVRVSSWLVLGPVATPLPAFHEAEERGFEAGDLLGARTLDVGDPWPEAGAPVPWPGGRSPSWRARSAGERGLTLRRPDSGLGHAFLAAFVETDRFLKTDLALRTGDLARVALDGEQVAERAEPGEEGTPITASLELTPGKHLVTVEAVTGAAGDEDAWRVQAALVPGSPDARLRISTTPTRPVRVSDLLDTEEAADVQASPDGELAALTLQQPAVPSEDRESWLEIRRTTDGEVARSFRGIGDVSGFRWGPEDGLFAYVSRADEKATLWVSRMDGGVEPVLEDVEHFGDYRWLPDGSGFVYSVSVEGETTHEEAKRLRGLRDRWAGWRDRSHLYRVDRDGGARQRLTSGPETTSLHDVSPDGERILFSRSRFVEERPFNETELWELELSSLESSRLLTYIGGGGAVYGPAGQRILLTAGPSAFGGVGSVLPDTVIPNDYDNQAFIYRREDGHVEPVSRDFRPAVGQVVWSGADGMIYLVAQDSVYSRLFRYDPGAGTYRRIQTGVEVLESVSLARNAPVAVYSGSGAGTPPRVLATSLEETGEPRLLAVPGEERWAQVEQPRVEDWSFRARGDTISGRIYYPPDFDSDQTYPLIVYYYGGTVPVSRNFGGRYPKELWAGLGYVVFVPQPSGATGFGQEFSARHVNDWGQRVAGEIVTGAERLLSEKDFLDPERVGCIGASFGGFMTMQLLTKTDLFAGCVAHAGISSISSYWGEGWWGYAYSAMATAGSYPWNRPDIYVERSPLFSADRITTPLLLLHGTADTNVPPGESEQLYTALEVLGREVEYVRILGENHQIFSYPKRVLWTNTIVAWFERTLKDRDGWWDHLWPESD